MPYRRLPTTDKARMRAMDAALKIASEKSIEKLAFSAGTLEELNLVKTNFSNAMKQYKADATLQLEKSKEYRQAFEKAHLYVLHFIQVIYMTIERGELKSEILEHYGLNDEKKIPNMNSETDLLNWGRQIINGEQKRMQKGGSPVYNPSIALVKVNVENFNEAAVYQHNLKRNTIRSHEKLQKQRTLTNEFISRMWNEIEQRLETGNIKHKRQRAQDYGIVYIYRKKEKKKLKSEDLQRDLLFDF